MNKLILLPFIIVTIIGQPATKHPVKPTEAKWSGTVFFQVTTNNSDGGSSIWKMEATIQNDTGTATHSSRFQRPNASGSCFNQAKTELEVGIDEEAGEYSIFVAVPGCYGRMVEYGQEKDYATTDETGIAINHQRLGPNHNALSGMIVDSAGEEGSSSVTIYRWNLTRGDITDELIVKPGSYDTWIPEAGPDEQSPGNKMQIDLRLQGRGGAAPDGRVVRFELKLNQTSSEPGIDLNMPVSGAGTLPDLRFQDNEEGGLTSDGQFITVESTDGKTGTAIIESYDGGGWTVLTAEAVLEGGRRVKGKLLNSAGVTDIQIPKRQPGTKIATAWLTANGNPGEMDDKETGGAGPGDGLTAYEEYRGVTTEGVFKRLDPRKKELGICMKPDGFREFREGVELFKVASGIIPVYFRDQQEIDADRNLNKNKKSAHSYDQKVLRIEDGETSKSAAGENRPISLEVMLPVQSELVVINLSFIRNFYPQQEAAARADGETMPYTLKEMINSTVAHEVGHGVNINHHGPPALTPQNRTAYEDSRPPYHIFVYKNGAVREIPSSQWGFDAGLNKRYYEIHGQTGVPGCEESGDLNCIMAYTSLYNWCFHQAADGSLHYYRVPLLPVGKKLCTSNAGTGINRIPGYFGNATRGNCVSQVKLR